MSGVVPTDVVDADEPLESAHASPTSARLTGAAVCALGALLWSLPTLVRLRRTPESWWIARDDGVITLSHARNLADYGTIGVSPGGDRVEGFSSPLHFASGTALELFADPSARDLTLWILALGLVVAGGAITWGVLTRLRGSQRRRAEAITLTVVLVTGAMTALPWTTAGWLGSGMENPLIVASMALVAAAAIAGLDRPAARRLAIAGSFLLMVSRVEFAALCGPILVALAASDRSAGGWPSAQALARFVALPLGAAALVHVLRRWYFGAWLPNTAIVQDRDAGVEQLAVIVTVALGFAAFRWRNLPMVAAGGRYLGGLVASACVVGLFWFEATGRTAQPVSSLLIIPGVVEFGVVAAAGLAALRWNSGAPLGSAHWVFAGLVLLPATQYVVTGAARLDDNRISGLMVPALIWWALLIWGESISAAVRSGATDQRVVGSRRLVAGFAAVTMVVGAGLTVRADGARSLNYEIGWADDVTAQVATLADEQFGGTGLVITATPDLGKISFAKGAHIVDLGWLGDPLFATIRADRPDLMDRYLLRVAVPDLVAAHRGWLCDYRGWIEDPAFLAEYELIGDPEADWRRGPDTCPADGGFPRWQRVIDNGEYELTRSLLTAGDPVGVVQEALEQCVERPGDSLRCQPVRRAAQRASQQLRDTGTFDDVVSAFAASPSAAFDEPMLRRGPAWWTTAAPAAIDLLEEFVS